MIRSPAEGAVVDAAAAAEPMAQCRIGTFRASNSPWVAPGTYSVRLTVNGRAYSTDHYQDGSSSQDHARGAADFHVETRWRTTPQLGRCVKDAARAW